MQNCENLERRNVIKGMAVGVLALNSIELFGSMDPKKMTFSRVASGTPTLIQKGDKKQWCPVCGMSLKMFYKTSHAAKTSEGEPTQYCSIRCLVLDHQNRNTDISNPQVIDAKTEKLIQTKNATYVVGSSAPATMSKVSKYAFLANSDAKEFQKNFGGDITDFKHAFKLASDSLTEDIAMVNAKREKKMYPMGKRLLKLKLKDKEFDLGKYAHINELKPDIKASCKSLKEKQLQAVALYLWDVKRFEGANAKNRVQVPRDAKCPVCGMFVSKYPRWAAQIVSNEKNYYFDGVKDMIKFLHNPKKYGAKADFKIKDIKVTDYYTQYAIDGKKAFYVLKSDVLGPMGNEPIPFATKSNAEVFKKDHKGAKILTLNNITSSIICELDGTVCE